MQPAPSDAPIGPCPRDSALLDLVAGRAGEGAEELRHHTHRCTACLAVLGELTTTYDDEPALNGRYELYEKLGEGEFGRVFRGWDLLLERDVAVKLYRERVLRGAVAEARTLAKLNHKNVVRVYDVGQSDQGSFVAMELVSGENLRAWLGGGQSNLAIRAVLLQAARGLAAVHRRSVVHRDLKPDNILVEANGRVAVADFGLANRLSSGAVRSGLAGSPAYMAPEVLRGEAASAASDVFSFCVTAWEAYAGARPFTGDSLSALQRAASQSAEAVAAVAIPRGLRRLLRAGVDANPEARPTAEDLVAALGPSTRRWRYGFASVALVMGVGAWQWVAADKPCRGADAIFAAVWSEERRAEVGAALVHVDSAYAVAVGERTTQALDRYSEAWIAMHTDVCEASVVRRVQSSELLDRRMACLQDAQGGFRGIVATLADADTATVENAHQLIATLRPVSRCADIERLLSEAALPNAYQAPRVARVRAMLAEVTARWTVGRTGDAATLLERAKVEASGIGYARMSVDIRLAEGQVLRALGRFEPSEAVFREALERAMAIGEMGPAREAAADLMTLVGRTLGRADEGLRYLEIVRSGGDLAWAASRTGEILMATGDYHGAAREFRHAVELREANPQGAAHDLHSDRMNLANALGAAGNHVQATTEHRRAAEALADVLGDHHPHVGVAAGNLAATLAREGRDEEAEEEFARALEVLEKSVGTDDARVSWARGGHAMALASLGRLGEAESEHRRSIEDFVALYGAQHGRVAGERVNLAFVLSKTGRFAEAEAEIRAAISVLDQARTPNAPNAATAHCALAATLAEAGKQETAEPEYALCIRRLSGALGDEHPGVAEARAGYAEVLMDRGRPEKAAHQVSQAWGTLQRADVPQDLLASASFVLARCSVALRRDFEGQDAAQLATDALQIYEGLGTAHAAAADEVRSWLAVSQ